MFIIPVTKNPRIYKPGDAPRVAFDVLGMNVARVKRLEDGSFDILARELQLYLDPSTGKVLHSWTNPMTNETVNGKWSPQH